MRSNILAIARGAWSMPPDHGAAVVRLVLESPELTALWRDELDGMRRRLRDLRLQLATAHPMLASLAEQHGLFSILPLTSDQVEAMRRDSAVYMAGSGRINVVGLNPRTVPTFARALVACLSGVPA
jgi:aromatic-amino-acid transaminase